MENPEMWLWSRSYRSIQKPHINAHNQTYTPHCSFSSHNASLNSNYFVSLLLLCSGPPYNTDWQVTCQVSDLFILGTDLDDKPQPPALSSCVPRTGQMWMGVMYTIAWPESYKLPQEWAAMLFYSFAIFMQYNIQARIKVSRLKMKNKTIFIHRQICNVVNH